MLNNTNKRFRTLSMQLLPKLLLANKKYCNYLNFELYLNQKQ
ncbi:MAG: hypothetical protein ACI9JT_002029 [Polaribacter sp.]|jgi:hypothetical protein